MVVLISTPCFADHGIENPYFKKKAMIMCANCGGYGHLYKSCNHPVISYGIICYNLFFDEASQSYVPKFLMVQRKDSLSYVEFIRGKYSPENRTYIMRLFANMTEDERSRLRANDFETLWRNMWCKTNDDETNKNFTKEYSESAEKFNLLKSGYLLKTENNELVEFSLDYLLNNTPVTYRETEWGFPKGRRNINEDDVSCALREFREEAGVHLKSIRLLSDVKPLEEVFSGSNKVRYKHVYYVARYVGETFERQAYQCREIKDAKWFTFEEMLERIRPYNVERRELAKRAYAAIMKRMTFYPRV